MVLIKSLLGKDGATVKSPGQLTIESSGPSTGMVGIRCNVDSKIYFQKTVHGNYYRRILEGMPDCPREATLVLGWWHPTGGKDFPA